MFSEEGGWPYGQVKDTDNILEKEKTIQELGPVRKVCFTPLIISRQQLVSNAHRSTSLLQNMAKPKMWLPSMLQFL